MLLGLGFRLLGLGSEGHDGVFGFMVRVTKVRFKVIEGQLWITMGRFMVTKL